MELSVARDVVVIANVAVAALEVVMTALSEGVATVGTCGRAVQDDECDGSHG